MRTIQVLGLLTPGVLSLTHPAVYHSLRHLFQITHCIGDSYIVADPGFIHWLDTILLMSDCGLSGSYQPLWTYYEFAFRPA